ncbi:MAG: hypothetical protein HY587_07970 [Candidatus Omnitrophica bacterium]|nr:hypothetical protein [Candidatus Omnitrophota bacterium]
MSIILDALKKVGSGRPSQILEDLKKRPKPLAPVRVVGPTRPKPLPAAVKKPRLKVVAPENENVIETKISTLKNTVIRWPAWAQGVGLGLGIVFGIMLLVGFGKLVFLVMINSPRRTEQSVLAGKADLKFKTNLNMAQNQNAGGASVFWAHPLMWASSQPKETAMSIRKDIADMIGYLGGGSQSSWLKGQFRVSGIIVDEQGEEFVIINEQLLRVGDRINGAQITKIRPESVELTLLDKVLKLEIS